MTALAALFAAYAVGLTVVVVVLDWRDSRHLGPARPRPCWVCGRPTRLLDDRGRPSHKVCAEQLLEVSR